MTTLSESSRNISPQKMRRSRLSAAVIAACAALFLGSPAAAGARTGAEQPEARQPDSGEKAEPLAAFLGRGPLVELSDLPAAVTARM